MRALLLIICSLLAGDSVAALSEKPRASQIVERGNLRSYGHKARQSYYPVQGLNSESLKASMLERGPIGHGRVRYYAYTLWNIKARPLQDSNLMRLSKCYISVHLPYLMPDATRAYELEQVWSRFYTNILAHEDRHVSNARRTCQKLKGRRFSKASFDMLIKRLKSRDIFYDRVSRHGQYEGVLI